MSEKKQTECKMSENEEQMDSTLEENISKCISNYIIVERILTKLDWKDQLNCAETCRLWNDVVRAIQRKCLRCYYFILASDHMIIQPRPMQVPPLVIFSFSKHASNIGCHYAICKDNHPCGEEAHNVFGVIEDELCDNSTTIFHIEQDYTIFSTISKEPNVTIRTPSRLSGLYLPKIPNVSCHSLAFRDMEHVQQDVYDVVDRICETDVMKAVIVFVECNVIFEMDRDMKILTYFKTKQPNIGFALGGCMVDRCTWKSEQQGEGWFPSIKIAVLSVPKIPIDSRSNFDVYSLIIPQAATKKAAIQREVENFAARVPEYQYTAGLKLSCIGRDNLNTFEIKCLRKSFPNTSIAGCFGDGEVGVEYPARPTPPAPRKKAKTQIEAFLYSYSTVFLYFGWGKLTKPAQITSEA